MDNMGMSCEEYSQAVVESSRDRFPSISRIEVLPGATLEEQRNVSHASSLSIYISNSLLFKAWTGKQMLKSVMYLICIWMRFNHKT